MHTTLRAIVCCAMVVATAALPALDAHAERTIRCRTNKLVNVGMIDAEVIGLCGEPKSRTVEEYPVLRRNPRNRTVAPTGDVARTERWIYELGQGKFDAQLTFENGKLVRIDLLTQR
jgi:Protein of unknown function (DUF2845)